jgi:hypothetical protein
MDYWKMPPKAKIYEALTAVADGRVTVTGVGQAEVVSSAGTKTYLVEWSADRQAMVSNDNASYWQGYMGYPMVAVLMVLGSVEYSPEVAARLAGIPWQQINKKFRNVYDKAVAAVLESLQEQGVDPQATRAEVDRIMNRLEQLSLQKLPRRRRPPSSGGAAKSRE